MHVDCDIFIANEGPRGHAFKRKGLVKAHEGDPRVRHHHVRRCHQRRVVAKAECDGAIAPTRAPRFYGDVDGAIKFLHYDGDDDEPDAEESGEDEDDALAERIRETQQPPRTRCTQQPAGGPIEQPDRGAEDASPSGACRSPVAGGIP